MSDDSSSLVSTSGFALRINGSCADTEQDCGGTVGSFRACCPAGSFCPSQYNVNCCPSSANCTESLVAKPKCANETWDLYDNNGYFCCLQDTTGYSTPGNSDGCASPGYPFSEDETLLSKISAGQNIATATSTTSSASSPTTTTTRSLSGTLTPPASTASSHGSMTTGDMIAAIVGSIGGFIVIVGVIWMTFRRHRRRRTAERPVPISDQVKESYTPVPELEGRDRAAELEGRFPELEGRPGQPIYELSSETTAYPSKGT
ncbi:hypothetical protein DTO166G4_6794 [Paecilomyces variotii]|uniref:Glycophorin A domain protein n=1 Tax=Byssochlamys spectabilis TaxID=264951 RepID=A0A443I2F7_BYSSP|nr:hypothetical protein C8Q69DRAFT_458213 [Paecilomyces variotii]KAJ9211655.1 hypothetical protein DTO166G4_6794 [Paecilomyces variotii]KAJ9220677.1 hypothetical protein DTO169C6_6918 [Paecilomyces variotii]KAJ9238692.1 hypothetical protein DTO166G5_2813 [Paecilomyces variotii]KAJ9270583.1 hypothetical protein DTO212C5_3372 [Paecilomyces variotii]KAJ9287679.1 hypothetical protein DTO021C3_4737 [Paecilomyces variotii]